MCVESRAEFLRDSVFVDSERVNQITHDKNKRNHKRDFTNHSYTYL